MPCTSPRTGWRGLDGKVSTKIKDSWIDKPITVPCGNCIDCRLIKRGEWQTRILHENRLHEQSCFVTITYDEEHLPFGGSLVQDELSKFMRRLRKATGQKLRFYGCAEYGGQTRRPHYHLIIFGYWPDDAKMVNNTPGKELYESETLKKIWGFGKADFAHVTPGSAAYVAGYIVDKINGDPAAEFYKQTDPETGEIFTLIPPYSRQSLKPGIGHDHAKRYLTDYYPQDLVVIDGQPRKPPRYYDKLCQLYRPDLWVKTKLKRAQLARDNWITVERLIDENSPELGTKPVQVHKDPNKYENSDKRRLVRAEIQRLNAKNRNNFQ